MRDETGTTVVEYAMIASLIAAVVVAAITVFGAKTGGLFDSIAAAVGAATGG